MIDRAFQRSHFTDRGFKRVVILRTGHFKARSFHRQDSLKKGHFKDLPSHRYDTERTVHFIERAFYTVVDVYNNTMKINFLF